MSLRFATLACLVLATGLLLGYLALSPEDEESPQVTKGQFKPQLSLIRRANSGFLISLELAPFQVGENDFRVTLLSPLGKPQDLDSAHVRLSRLESKGSSSEIEAAGSRESKRGSLVLHGPGWWQIDVTANAASIASFYVKLEQPSKAPDAYAPPDYPSNPEALHMFQTAVSRYENLAGLKTIEELTSGEPGASGYGVWFVTNIDSNLEGYHATTLNVEQGGSELYADLSRQCFRQGRELWQCSPGPSPVGPFDLFYLKNATGFKKGLEEVVDGEMTQVIFFYNQSQGAWYVWWVGEQTSYIRRQAMVAKGHFMLDRFSDHDLPQPIRPKDLPPI